MIIETKRSGIKMKESLRARCELFIENRDVIRESFTWQSSYLYPLCSSILTSKNQRADIEKLKECKRLLHSKTGVFSNFRGISKSAIITMLSTESEPRILLDRILQIYDMLKELFFPSEYLTVAAASIAQIAEPDQYSQIVRKTRTIYEKMKQNHPFLTSSSDSAFASLIALSEINEDYAVQEMEHCYEILHPQFFSSNAVQSLSHILTLGEGSSQIKCQRVMTLFERLKEKGHKYGTGEELATLGVLSMLNVDLNELVEEIIEVDEFLEHQKGFGIFGVGSKQRMMYAGILTMCDFVSHMQQTMNTAALNSVMSLVIAQQAALCASTAVVATTAANSSGNQ